VAPLGRLALEQSWICAAPASEVRPSPVPPGVAEREAGSLAAMPEQAPAPTRIAEAAAPAAAATAPQSALAPSAVATPPAVTAPWAWLAIGALGLAAAVALGMWSFTRQSRRRHAMSDEELLRRLLHPPGG
jgi:hypothetical protein